MYIKENVRGDPDTSFIISSTCGYQQKKPVKTDEHVNFHIPKCTHLKELNITDRGKLESLGKQELVTSRFKVPKLKYNFMRIDGSVFNFLWLAICVDQTVKVLKMVMFAKKTVGMKTYTETISDYVTSLNKNLKIKAA